MLLTSFVYVIFTLSANLCIFCEQYRIVRISLAPRSYCESILTWFQSSLELQIKLRVCDLLIEGFSR